MHAVPSTYKVLANRALQQDSTDDWIDWAMDMIEAGFESEHLYILAGMPRQINSFELNAVVNRTLEELSLNKNSDDEVINDYVNYLIGGALHEKIPTKQVLYQLRDLCQQRDYDRALYPFYLLYFALEELEEMGVQFYWQGEHQDNIHVAIREQFLKWKRDYDSND